MPSFHPASLALLCLTTFNCCFWSDRIQAQVPPASTPSLEASTEASTPQLNSSQNVSPSTPPALPSHSTIQSLKQNISSRAADLTPQSFPPSLLSSTPPASPPSPSSAPPPPASPLNEAAIRNYILGLQLPPASAVGLPIARVQIVLTNHRPSKPIGNKSPLRLRLVVGIIFRLYLQRVDSIASRSCPLLQQQNILFLKLKPMVRSPWWCPLRSLSNRPRN